VFVTNDVTGVNLAYMYRCWLRSLF